MIFLQATPQPEYPEAAMPLVRFLLERETRRDRPPIPLDLQRGMAIRLAAESGPVRWADRRWQATELGAKGAGVE